MQRLPPALLSRNPVHRIRWLSTALDGFRWPSKRLLQAWWLSRPRTGKGAGGGRADGVFLHRNLQIFAFFYSKTQIERLSIAQTHRIPRRGRFCRSLAKTGRFCQTSANCDGRRKRRRTQGSRRDQSASATAPMPFPSPFQGRIAFLCGNFRASAWACPFG